MPNGKQNLKELTQIICTGASSLLFLNFLKFKKMQELSVSRNTGEKFHVWSVSKRLTNNGGNSTVSDLFFFIFINSN